MIPEGFQWRMVDIDEQKTEFARERDLNIVNSMKEDIGDYLEKVTGKRQVDAVIEGTGSSAGLNQSIEYVKPVVSGVFMEYQSIDSGVDHNDFINGWG